MGSLCDRVCLDVNRGRSGSERHFWRILKRSTAGHSLPYTTKKVFSAISDKFTACHCPPSFLRHQLSVAKNLIHHAFRRDQGASIYTVLLLQVSFLTLRKRNVSAKLLKLDVFVFQVESSCSSDQVFAHRLSSTMAGFHSLSTLDSPGATPNHH